MTEAATVITLVPSCLLQDSGLEQGLEFNHGVKSHILLGIRVLTVAASAIILFPFLTPQL